MGVLLRKISPYSTHLPTKCVEVRLPPPSSNHIILMNINELKMLISVLTKYLLCILKIFNLTDLNWCLEFIIRSFVDKPGSSPPYLCFVVFFLCLASWTWISHLVCRGDGKQLAIGWFIDFFGLSSPSHEIIRVWQLYTSESSGVIVVSYDCCNILFKEAHLI